MEYIFGTNDFTGDEILKTKGSEHTDFAGYCQTVQEFTDSTITDSFRVLEKYHSDEDDEGNCYDWYIIDRHNRVIDKTKLVKEQTQQNRYDIDFLAMETGIDLDM